ncbi:MAG TPA: hypothetical protein DEF51_05600, partial [Myxococcales bacterium]|nr:hypothetical protein [Myxococcales bacterium]
MLVAPMRTLSLSLFALLAACGAEETGDVPELATGSGTAAVALEADVEADVEAAAATHGGTVVAVGAHHVEVVAHDEGVIDAFLLGEAPPVAETQITVSVSGDDGEVHPVLLTWHPSEGRYQGRMHHAQPIPGPVEVAVTIAGERAEGRAPRLLVLAPEAVEAAPTRARVATRGAADTEQEAEEVEAARDDEAPSEAAAVAQPASPAVVIQPAPGVVAVQRPAAPGAVVVQRPAPPGATVVERRGPARGGVRVRTRGGASVAPPAAPPAASTTRGA